MLRSSLVMLAMLPSVAFAETEFELTAFRKSSSDFYEIVVQGTKKDQEIVKRLKATEKYRYQRNNLREMLEISK